MRTLVYKCQCCKGGGIVSSVFYETQWEALEGFPANK